MREEAAASNECPPAEDLAAFVDHKLDGDRREKTLLHIVQCSDCYETFSETARFLDRTAPQTMAVATDTEPDKAKKTGHGMIRAVFSPKTQVGFLAVAASYLVVMLFVSGATLRKSIAETERLCKEVSGASAGAPPYVAGLMGSFGIQGTYQGTSLRSGENRRRPELQKFDEKADRIERAFLKTSDRPKAWLGLVSVNLLLERKQKAYRWAGQGKELFPNHFGIRSAFYFTQFLCAEEEDENETKVDALTEMKNLQHENPGEDSEMQAYWYNLGYMFEKMNQCQEAKRSYEKYLALAPKTDAIAESVREIIDRPCDQP